MGGLCYNFRKRNWFGTQRLGRYAFEKNEGFYLISIQFLSKILKNPWINKINKKQSYDDDDIIYLLMIVLSSAKKKNVN